MRQRSLPLVDGTVSRFFVSPSYHKTTFHNVSLADIVSLVCSRAASGPWSLSLTGVRQQHGWTCAEPDDYDDCPGTSCWEAYQLR